MRCNVGTLESDRGDYALQIHRRIRNIETIRVRLFYVVTVQRSSPYGSFPLLHSPSARMPVEAMFEKTRDAICSTDNQERNREKHRRM